MKDISQKLQDAIALLKEYEQWEADIISEDELWQPYRAKDVLRGKIYNTMMNLQQKRNALLGNIDVVGKRVRWHPVDTEETFDGTIVEEKEFLFVVVPDDGHAPTQNWNKKTCEIIGGITIPMLISGFFKKYPENDPNYKGVHFLTITKYNNTYSYSLTLFDDDCEWNPKHGEVVAFAEADPEAIMLLL